MFTVREQPVTRMEYINDFLQPSGELWYVVENGGQEFCTVQFNNTIEGEHRRAKQRAILIALALNDYTERDDLK